VSDDSGPMTHSARFQLQRCDRRARADLRQHHYSETLPPEVMTAPAGRRQLQLDAALRCRSHMDAGSDAAPAAWRVRRAAHRSEWSIDLHRSSGAAWPRAGINARPRRCSGHRPCGAPHREKGRHFTRRIPSWTLSLARLVPCQQPEARGPHPSSPRSACRSQSRECTTPSAFRLSCPCRRTMPMYMRPPMTQTN
jgi:hypothetical protein